MGFCLRILDLDLDLDCFGEILWLNDIDYMGLGVFLKFTGI